VRRGVIALTVRCTLISDATAGWSDHKQNEAFIALGKCFSDFPFVAFNSTLVSLDQPRNVVERQAQPLVTGNQRGGTLGH